MLRNIVSRCEQRLERRRILLWCPAFGVVKRVRGQSKVGGAQRSLTYAAAIKEFPHVRVPRAGDLVQVFGSAHDKAALYARGLERRDEGRPEGGLCNSEDHSAGPRRVDQWAEDVEERAEGQRTPCWGEGGERWVVVPRGNKGERDVRNGSGGYGPWWYKDASETLQEVRRSGGRSRRSTSMLHQAKLGRGRNEGRITCLHLDDPSTGPCCDDGGGGTNVKRIVSVPAGADDIDDKIVFRVNYNSRDGA